MIARVSGQIMALNKGNLIKIVAIRGILSVRDMAASNGNPVRKKRLSSDSAAMNAILLSVEESLGIKNPSDWYRVTSKDLENLGVYWHFRTRGGLLKTLQELRPSETWFSWKFQRTPKGALRETETVLMALNLIEKALELKGPEDWYHVTNIQLEKLGVDMVIIANGNLFDVLSQYRTSSKWVPWKFVTPTKEMMHNPRNIEISLQYLEKELSILNPEDWYRVSRTQLIELGVYPSLKANGGVQKVLSLYRSSFQWIPWKFEINQSKLSRNPDRIKDMLDYIEQTLALETQEDWLSVSKQQLESIGALGFIAKIGPLYQILGKFRSKFVWYPWKFGRLDNGLSRNEDSIATALDFVEKSLNITSPENWYEVSEAQLKELGVNQFFRQNGYMMDVLKRYRPNVHWVSWKFKHLRNGVTSDPQVVEEVLGYVERTLGIVNPDQWYDISKEKLEELGVYQFIRNNGYLLNVLNKYRPQYKWLPWRFLRIPKGLQHNMDILNSAISSIENELNIKQPEEWYRVSKSQLARLEVSRIIEANGGLYEVLKQQRPSFQWDASKFFK